MPEPGPIRPSPMFDSAGNTPIIRQRPFGIANPKQGAPPFVLHFAPQIVAPLTGTRYLPKYWIYRNFRNRIAPAVDHLHGIARMPHEK